MKSPEAGDIRRILADAIAQSFGLDLSQIETEAPLFSSALLSSVQLIQMIMLLEEKFGITIPSFEVGMETFDTIDAMANYIEHKLAAAR